MGDNDPNDNNESRMIDGVVEDSDISKFDTITVECYRRRDKILAGTYHAEWWMAIAVLLITAGIAFVLL